MASFRKPAANKQLKSPFANDVNSSDAKFKGRGLVAGGIIVPNRIFVGGICPKATPDDLAALFRKYGAVTAIKIVADQNGLSKGYGFVTFEKADDVSKLQCDAENLYINNKQLNIAPAIMKYPQNIGRYPDSIVMPLSPNLYFTNGLQYQYSEAAPVYPNSSYTPQVAVLPTVSDAAYYSTPYHGTALFYPLSPSTPQIVVGSHQPYSCYQPMHSSNSNYAYSSQTSQTTSPASSTGKTSSSMNAPSNTMNATDMHVSHGTPIMTNMPPNMTSLPPPVPYPVSHPPQYYNGSVMPQFAGDMYYNMVPGTCYPMMTVNGQDTYVPYYEVGETCNANMPSECHLICAQEANMDMPHTYSISVPSQPPYHHQQQQHHSDAINGGKESSPPTANGPNSEPVKALVPLGPPPVTAAEHISAEHPYGAENSGANSGGGGGGGNVGNSNAAANSGGNGGHAHGHHNGNGGSVTPLTQQPPLAAPPPPPPQQQIAPPPAPPHVDYNSSAAAAAAAAFIHRSTATTAIISPYPPIPQQNLYFNSVYMSEATSASLVGPCPYSKNLSEHYVSDHLPKRDIKHTPKKFNGGPTPLVSHSGGNGGAGNGSVNGGGAGANHHQQPPQQQQQPPHHHGNGQNGGGGSMNGNHNGMKDQPPNIPKFPFLVNNNYPGFVNRNMKEKDYKSGGGGGMGGGGGGPKGPDGKPVPRPPRNNSLGGGGNGGGSLPPKPRVFHNQSQYSGGGGGPPRSQRIDRNGHMVPNMQYSRSGPPVMSRQNSYDQPQPNPYDYANNHHHPHYHHHQGHPASYIKHMGYESHPRRYHPGNNSGGYRGYNKHERSNGAGNEAAAYHHRNSSNPMDEPRPRKYHNQHDEGMAAAPPAATTTATSTSSSVVATNIEHTQPEQSSTPVGGNTQSQQQQLQQSQPPPPQQVPPSQQQQQPPPQQQLCAEMQKLAV